MGKTSGAGYDKRKCREIFTSYSFLAPAYLFLILFMAYPVCYNIALSFKNVSISNLVSGNSVFIGFANFKKILADPYMWDSLKNTFVFMVFCLSFQFVFGMLLALFFNKSFAGAKWMRSIVLVGWMNPVIISGTIFKWLLSGDSGVINYFLMQLGVISEPIMFLANPSTGMFSLTFANIWIGIPFNMILLLSGMQSLSSDVYESASIDGAGSVAKFFRITLPLLKPTISILIMMGIINTFKVFDLIYIMTKGGPSRATQTLPYYSYEKTFSTYKFGEGAASSVIMLIVVLVFSLIYLSMSRKESDTE